MFPNKASEFVYTRTYSRWLDDKNRRETWPETVDRYIAFIVKHRGELIPPKVLKKIKENILSFNVMPSMRALWAAGSAAEFDNTCLYNCSFLTVDSIESFSEALYVLMNGSGEGFSVETKYIEKLPLVPIIDSNSLTKYLVKDNKAGWADSVKDLLNELYSGKDLDIDYSQLRPKGSKLKTMGGRSSGPEPLVILHNFIKQTVYNAQGRKLSSLECHDIMNQIAESVVVGGVRRSSQVSLSDLNDELMRNAKNWPFPPRRSMANNSAMYYTKPSATDFLKEWANLASSGTGERGISNFSNHNSVPKRRDKSLISGANPCVSGDTEILTDDGYKQIKDIVNQPITIWNGFEWSEVIPKITGKDQNMVTVSFSDGRILRCTEYHNFHIQINYKDEKKIIMAKNLQPGMKLIKHKFPVIEHELELQNPYTTGFVSAEGMELNKNVYVYKPKEMCLNRIEDLKTKKWSEINNRWQIRLNSVPMSKSFVPLDYNLKSRLEWLSGLFDGDGTELKEGGLQLSSINRKFLFNLQKLLTTMGIQSKIVFGSSAGYKEMPNHKDGNSFYFCQESYRICIDAVQMQDLKSLGLKCERMKFDKNPQRDATQFVTVVDVTESGIEDTVYCFNEPKRNLGIFNGIITGQCFEILLRSKQFCNLSEVVIKKDDDLLSLLEKVETATWIGIIQSTFTYFPYLSKEWKQNCEEERLLGVSLTGQMDNPEILTEDVLKALRNKAIKVAKHASQKMNINMPAAITCVKPSGTVSQLVDSASGIHARYSNYYIRRYRISATDPLLKLIKEQGLKINPENGQEKLKEEDINTWVVSFPVKAPEGCITRDKMNALQQLEWYKRVQTNWCEHNTSMTVYVKDEEWFEVGNWVYKNWEIVNGVSFLPYDGGKYQQAPYEEITKDQYEKLLKNFPDINYQDLHKYETEDNTEGAKSYNCTGDRCEIT